MALKFNQPTVFNDNDVRFYSIPDSAALSPTGAISACAWVWVEDVTDTDHIHSCIAKYVGANNWRSWSLFVQDTTGVARAILSPDGTSGASTFMSALGATQLTSKTWHHIAFVFIPSTSLTVFLDGVQDGQDTSSPASEVDDNSSEIWIGCHFNNRASNGPEGLVAECAFWDRALTDDEIAYIAAGNDPRNVHFDNLLLYCPLDVAIEEKINNYTMTLETGPSVTDASLPNLVADHPPVFRNYINVTPQTATANYINKSTGTFISHEDMNSPSAGDMMRIRLIRDYNLSANTDDMQLHKLVLWQKGDA